MDLHSEKFVVLYYRFILEFVQGSLIALCIARALQCGFSYNGNHTAPMVMLIEDSVENEGWREDRAVHQIFSNYYLLNRLLIRCII